MKIIGAKKINENRKVLKYMNGDLFLSDSDNNRISLFYDYIGDFNYNEDLKTLVAIVKINIGSSLRKNDVLIGYINIDGKLVSSLYSVYFDKFFSATDDEVGSLINSIYNRLFYESNIEEEKEKSAILKMKLLFKENGNLK